MKNTRLLIIMTMLVSLMLACNISVGGDSAAPATPVVVVVTQLVPADTAAPQEEPTATSIPADQPTDEPVVVATSTASTPLVTPVKDPVNCRFGPSIFYEQIYALNVGAYMPVVGKSADGGWWLAGIPSSSTNNQNQACWVGKSVTNISGDTSNIPTVAAPEAFITDASLKIKPNLVNAGVGCATPPSTPFALTGIIVTNGPLEIRWYVETEQDGRLPEKVLKFDRFGPHPVSFTFAPSVWQKGNYWIRIVITKPKSMVSDTTYQVKCQ